MPNWRAVAAGVAAFPVAIGVGMVTGGLVMLVAGLPSACSRATSQVGR